MTIQEQILESASQLRGKVIQMTIELELRIDIIIGNYFTSDEEKHRELTLLVFGPINLKNKIPILEYILFKDKTNTKQNIKDLLKNIKAVVEERNAFAHWPVNISEEGQEVFADKRHLMFVKLRQGGDGKGNPEIGQQKTFSETKATKLIRCIESINTILNKIIAN